MQTIWKYPITVTDRFTLNLPKGAQILSLQPQHDQVCLWALVDPDQPKEARLFRLFGTGHAVEEGDRLSFVGTFQVQGGSLVFHVFEYMRKEFV
jgi:hypothetical protein